MFQFVTDYLTSRDRSFRTSYDKTEAIICCLFCEDTKWHLYIENTEGCFLCHKCGAKGSFKDLVEKLGDHASPTLESSNQIEYTAQLVDIDMTKINPSLADEYHHNLPEKIRQYLKSDQRGLTDETISKFKVGWDGLSITVPVFDKNGSLINIRHRRDPGKSEGPKIWGERGSGTSLFNTEVLAQAKANVNLSILITEGEFDAMIATQYGFPSVSSTGGAGTFKDEWVKEFEGIETVYICYDTDDAGQKGAERVASLFRDQARVVKLPSDGSHKVDITDYFARLKHSPEDFQQLLDQAEPFKTVRDRDSKDPDFELLSSKSQRAIHPTLDYYDGQLYLTLRVPVRVDEKETIKQILISSSRQKALIGPGKVKINGLDLPLRKVTNVPGDQLRWPVEEIQRFLEGKEQSSPALPFIEIRQTLLRFVDFRRETDADILTSWVLGTYCFPIFDAFPYLYFVGVKRSGKTKTLQLIEKLAFNGILSSNISPAVLFRLVEAKRCTLALDESEQLAGKEGKEKRQEIQELLNSGYKHGAPAYRVRKNSKGEFEIEAFEVYAPKAIANISGLDNVLEDRAITIVMVRTNNSAKGNLAVTENAESWSYLRSLLYNFALNYAKQIADTYHANPEVNALLNRQNELWRPLLSIARVVDNQLPGSFARIKDEAVRRAEEASGADLEDFDSAVLFALRDLIGSEEESELTNKEVHKQADEYLEEDQRQYLTSRGVGAALKRFGIRGKRVQGNWRYTVSQETLNYLIGRYCPDNQ